MVRSSPLVMSALSVGSAASNAFSCSRSLSLSAWRLPKIMTERPRSCDTSSATCERRRWRISSRLRLVTSRMTTAIAATSSTKVRMPCLGRMRSFGVGSSFSAEPAFGSRDKFISCAVNREQMPRVCRVRLQLLAKLQNLIVYGSRRWIKVITPHFVQQNIAGEHALRIFGKELQQIKIVGGEDDRRTVAHHRHFSEVYLAIGKTVGVLRCRSEPAANGGLHARGELARAEGLGHVVVGAEFQKQHLVGDLGNRAQHDDGNLTGKALEGLTQLAA